MRLTMHAFLTLDGVMQGPGGAEEDRSDGFEHGGWLVPYADQDMGEIVDSWFARCGAVLLGRRTYAMMQAYWSQVTDPDNRVAAVLNHGTKYVVSTTLTDASWGDTTILASSEDVITAVAALKESGGDGELQVHGSAQLAATLHQAGLVDEYRLLTFPVTLGQGKRLFGAGAPPRGFTVTDTRVTSTGAIYATLVPHDLTNGTFTVVDGKEAL